METLTSLMSFLPPWMPSTVTIVLTTWLMLAIASWLSPPPPRRYGGHYLTPLGWRWIERTLRLRFRKDPVGVQRFLDERLAEIKLPSHPERGN